MPNNGKPAEISNPLKSQDLGADVVKRVPLQLNDSTQKGVHVPTMKNIPECSKSELERHESTFLLLD